MEPGTPLTHWAAPAPVSVRLVPLKPTQMPTTAPAGRVGVAGCRAAELPASITSGLKTDTPPVAGSKMAACTKAFPLELFMWHMLGWAAAAAAAASWASTQGVASPTGVSGSRGTASVQLTSATAAGGVGRGGGAAGIGGGATGIGTGGLVMGGGACGGAGAGACGLGAATGGLA